MKTPRTSTAGHDVDTEPYRPQSNPKIARATAVRLASAHDVYAALADLRHSSPFMADALQKMANGASMEEAALGFTRDAPHLAAELIVGESSQPTS